MNDADTPNYNNTAEQAVLGAMLMSATALEDAAQMLGAADFYRRAHHEIFDAIVTLSITGKDVDVIIVEEELSRRGVLGKVGGAPYLHTCLQECVAPASVGYWAEIVANKSKLRRLREAGLRIVQFSDSSSADDDIDRVVENARQVIDQVALDYRAGDADFDLGAALDDLLVELDSPAPPAIGTGLHDLDEALSGGLFAGDLVVVGARPGVGKSVLGLNMAAHVASGGLGAVFAALEMSKGQCLRRLVASEGSIELNHLMRHTLTQDDWRRAAEVSARLVEWPLDIDFRPNHTVTSIRGRARDWGRKHKLGLIVVDYLQLMTSKGARERRDLEIGENTRGLKLLAKEMQVPVVAVSQVNRGSEQRADRRPQLNDLRESGSIEADADTAILLHRDSAEPTDIELIIAKQRMGAVQTVTARWRGHYQRIDSAAGRHLEVV